MAKPIVEITGFPELEKKIKALSDDKSKKREVVGILKQVASSTVKAAKQTAPISKKKHTARGRVIQPGNLKKSIGSRRCVYTRIKAEMLQLFSCCSRNTNGCWLSFLCKEPS